jgi:hypothetical protein
MKLTIKSTKEPEIELYLEEQGDGSVCLVGVNSRGDDFNILSIDTVHGLVLFPIGGEGFPTNPGGHINVRVKV